MIISKKGNNTISKIIKNETILKTNMEEKLQYGVEWNQNTDTLTRLGQSVGLTGGSDFSNLGERGVWGLRRCTVRSQTNTVSYYVDPSDPTKIGEVVDTTYQNITNFNYTGGMSISSHGEVMVEIPKFYWKIETIDDNVYRWWVSPIKLTEDYEIHPAFITNSIVKDYIYLGAFESRLTNASLPHIFSGSGVTPTASKTIDEFRILAKAESMSRAPGWGIQNYWATHAVQLLYLVEYADFDSQTTIGRGRVATSSNSIAQTGATIFLGNESGGSNPLGGLSFISYRGIENPWGNMNKFIDGINMNSSREVFVSNENFESNVFSGSYQSVGFLPSNNNFISNIHFPHFLPTVAQGSDSSFLYDFYNLNETTETERVLRSGGRSFDGTFAGLFLVDFTMSNTTTFNTTGARLQLL